MRYLFLIYAEEARLHAMAPAELADIERERAEWEDCLQESGHLESRQLLYPAATATTVRVRSGRLSLTDGPSHDSREQLVGLYLVHARDLNEAIRVAARTPPARLGSIEVRPIREAGTSSPTLLGPARVNGVEAGGGIRG